MTAESAVPEQHEETAGLQTPMTQYEQMQNILTLFVTAVQLLVHLLVDGATELGPIVTVTTDFFTV